MRRRFLSFIKNFNFDLNDKVELWILGSDVCKRLLGNYIIDPKIIGFNDNFIKNNGLSRKYKEKLKKKPFFPLKLGMNDYKLNSSKYNYRNRVNHTNKLVVIRSVPYSCVPYSCGVAVNHNEANLRINKMVYDMSQITDYYLGINTKIFDKNIDYFIEETVYKEI